MDQLDGANMGASLSVEDTYRLEEAIDYMWRAFTKSGPHAKPVRVHSIRIALALEADGTDIQLVIAALLHDLIEDTDVTEATLRKDYGDTITEIVLANSYGHGFTDRRKRDLDMYERCVQYGAPACLIKAADLYDNSSYFFPLEEARAAWFREKMLIFSKMTEPLIGTEAGWVRHRERALLLNQ